MHFVSIPSKMFSRPHAKCEELDQKYQNARLEEFEEVSNS